MRALTLFCLCTWFVACGADPTEQADPWNYEEEKGAVEQESPSEMSPPEMSPPEMSPPEISPEPSEPTPPEPIACEPQPVRQHWYLEDALSPETTVGRLRGAESRWVLEVTPILTREAPHLELLLRELTLHPKAQVRASEAIGLQGVLVTIAPKDVSSVLGSLCHAEFASLTGFHCDARPESCDEIEACSYLTRGIAESFALGLGESDPIIGGCNQEAGCGDLGTGATDPNGNSWFFPDTCTPDSW